MKKLKVKLLRKTGKINMPAYKGDAGYDVYSTQNVSLAPHCRYAMPLGIALEFDKKLVCQVNTKSGNSVKLGFDTIGNIIDSNYRGEIHCIIVNTTSEILYISKGEKVAQLIFLRYLTPKIQYASKLSISNRNKKWKGSSK